MTSPYRVLVVEDYEPFRRVICELLRERSDVLIVGEAADGLDAVRQAEVLRPDLVMLDIGLPTLSGIEAAFRIRVLVPDAKLMFVTIESSFEVVEQAFSSGAHGYVYKPRAQRDVLPVFDAIIRGARFVSGGLERISRGDSLASHRHDVVFCSSDAVLVEAFSRFIASALHQGNVVAVLVTEEHHQSLQSSLRDWDVDLVTAIRQKRYVPVNINELLAKEMANGSPNLTRLVNATEDLMSGAMRRAARHKAKVAACGECSAAIWAHGHIDAAIQLEHIWDEIAKSREMDVLCAYPLTAREERGAVRSLCAEHTVVEIS